MAVSRRPQLAPRLPLLGYQGWRRFLRSFRSCILRPAACPPWVVCLSFPLGYPPKCLEGCRCPRWVSRRRWAEEACHRSVAHWRHLRRASQGEPRHNSRRTR